MKNDLAENILKMISFSVLLWKNRTQETKKKYNIEHKKQKKSIFVRGYMGFKFFLLANLIYQGKCRWVT